MKLRRQDGFTLIEVMVVAAIIAVLAGILVPMIFKEVDEAKIARAQADCKTITTAILAFRKDTGKWPFLNSANGNPEVTALYSGGAEADMPTLPQEWTQGVTKGLTEYMRDTHPSYTNWKGPYLVENKLDPWGHAYVINSAEFITSGHVFVLSSGPDGQIQTLPTDDAVSENDYGVRIQ